MENFIIDTEREAFLESQSAEWASPEREGSKTLMNDLFNSDIPPHGLSTVRLQNRTMGILAAGIQMTINALAVASFHILNDSSIYLKLREELHNAIPDPSIAPLLPDLEKSPYLSACIEEGKFLKRFCFL